MPYRFILFIIGVLVFTSCHEDKPNSSGPKEVQKTIIMYLPFTESPSLYDSFLTNISDIESSISEQRGLGNNRLLVFVSQSSVVSRLIEIGYSKNRVVRDTIETYRDHEFTTTEGFSKILTKVKETAPATDYGMIIGCHGEGWMPATPGSSPKRSRYFGSGAVAFRTDVATLAEAIDASDMHMQFILFDVCYMSCIETTYELRYSTDYVIASTSEVMSFGMPYDKVLQFLLTAQPDYERLNQTYLDFYNNNPNVVLPYATLGITKCEFLDEMAELMRNINMQYHISDEDLEKVQDLDAGRYTPNVYFDFGDYVEKTLAQDGEPDDNKAQLLSQFRTLLDKLVPYKSTTGKIMSAYPYQIINVNEFSGLTISDPSIHRAAVETKTATEWWRATH